MSDTIREFEFLTLVEEALAEVATDGDKIETCEEVRRIVTKKILARMRPSLMDRAGKVYHLTNCSLHVP